MRNNDDKDILKIPKPCETAVTVHSLKTDLEDINTLNFSGFWEINNKECYSEWFVEEVQKLRIIVIEFIQEGYPHSVSERYNQDFLFFRELAFHLLESDNIISAIFRANGWKGRLGLELAKARLKIYKKEKGRNPVQRDKGFDGLQKALRRKLYWEKYGIRTWNELLNIAFGDVNHKFGELHGIKGLELAKGNIRQFYYENGRIPTTRDKGMSQYTNIIARGIWKGFGITKWNDLLKLVFNQVNKKSSVYRGDKGLKYAELELRKFEITHGRIPKATDSEMAGILAAIKRKYWIMQEICTWNDLLLRIFGKVNKYSNTWIGKEGYKRAKRRIRDFHLYNNRKPVRRDKGMSGIVKAIQRGYWADLNVNSWKILLKKVFGG